MSLGHKIQFSYQIMYFFKSKSKMTTCTHKYKPKTLSEGKDLETFAVKTIQNFVKESS
jgi:hypothetical protein